MRGEDEEWFPLSHFDVLQSADDGCPGYALKLINKPNECVVNAALWELNAWGDGEARGEVLAEVMLKWDGCGHWTFSGGGYQHLCGRSHVKAFGEALLWAFDALGKEIPKWDEEVAS